ncbi:AraC family transcriptional regulator [Paenibacillus sp. KQZ6P-2]|uniref:AraC family transcriptional regulator n=1 Tax=Paenibacillus mangrovi TaxID=2931978 RepID=A0A9X1WQU0_9BACL|nr:helix-turn-helix domain-containing protein [Paenibacillus mangrovi]MCJ8013687.1 AraC family transcriptional regulator [Paenibacillus mangrovi]
MLRYPKLQQLRSFVEHNRFIPRQTHIRIFLGLCLLFTLVSVPFIFLLTSQFSKYAMKQIDKVNQAELAHSRDNAEFIFNKMIAYGLNMYADKDIQAWMSSGMETGEAEVEALSAGTRYMTTEPFLENAYLINMRTEHVIDLKYGISSFKPFKDQDILALTKQPRSAYQRYFIHRINGLQMLALMIPTVPSGQPSYGYLVLFLDNALLKQYLLKDNGNAGFNSFILDDKGEVMLGSSESKELYAELAAKSVHDSGKLTQIYEGDSWSIQYARIEPQGWSLYQMAKMEGIRSDFQSFQAKMMAFIACMVALLLAILFWNSRRTYMPFSQLANQLEMKFGLLLNNKKNDYGPTEEYKVIRYGIEMLEDRMVQLNSSMREHRDVIKTEYLRQWVLQGKLITPVEQYLREQTKLFQYEGLYVSVIRINGYSAFKEKYSFASRKLIKYAMGNIAEEIMNRRGYAESIDLGSDHLVLLVAGNPLSSEHITALLEEVKEQIYHWTQVRITLSVSERKGISDDIRAIYQHIHELTMLKFVSGEDKIYMEGDFENYMRSVQPLADDNLVEELITKVRLGKPEEVIAGLNEIFVHMQSMHYSQSRFQLSLMLYTLFKSFNKLPSIESIEGIENILESFDTLFGVRGWLEKELLGIIDELSLRKGSSRKDEIVTEIVDYVKNHLHDPMLTIEEIAEHLSLSTRHVRQLFKDVLDLTLSDYILQARITKVKELLVSTHWTVTDIGERAGFQTKSHFFTIFKKATGMTPSQYRDMG